jgi:hypothetical protein
MPSNYDPSPRLETPGPRPPERVLQERDRRRELRLKQNPIDALMAHPLPGESALDQRGKR